jgi:hypothetical protein
MNAGLHSWPRDKGYSMPNINTKDELAAQTL